VSTLIHHFDLPQRFPVLEPDSKTKSPPIVERAEDEKGSFLRIICERLQSDDVGEAIVVLALPLLGVAGKVERFDLDVLGDSSGTRVYLEVTDQRGLELLYSFGETDFSDWRTCRADANQPIEHRSASEDHMPKIVEPLEPRKLVLKREGASGTHLTSNASAKRPTVSGTHPAGLACVVFDIGIRTLSGVGDVRLVPTGIA